MHTFILGTFPGNGLIHDFPDALTAFKAGAKYEEIKAYTLEEARVHYRMMYGRVIVNKMPDCDIFNPLDFLDDAED